MTHHSDYGEDPRRHSPIRDSNRTSPEVARSEISLGLLLGEDTVEGQFWIKKGLKTLRGYGREQT